MHRQRDNSQKPHRCLTSQTFLFLALLPLAVVVSLDGGGDAGGGEGSVDKAGDGGSLPLLAAEFAGVLTETGARPFTFRQPYNTTACTTVRQHSDTRNEINCWKPFHQSYTHRDGMLQRHKPNSSST